MNYLALIKGQILRISFFVGVCIAMFFIAICYVDNLILDYLIGGIALALGTFGLVPTIRLLAADAQEVSNEDYYS